MILPTHTRGLLILYTHAVLVITHKQNCPGHGYWVHSFLVLFLIYHPDVARLLLFGHGLWLAWMASLDPAQGSAVVAFLVTLGSVVVMLLAGQFVRRTQRHGRKVSEGLVMVVAGSASILAMAFVARYSPTTFINLHLRTATYYTLVWMLQIAVGQTELLQDASLELISLVLSFTALGLPLVATGVLWAITVVYISLNREWVVVRTGHSPGPP